MLDETLVIVRESCVWLQCCVPKGCASFGAYYRPEIECPTTGGSLLTGNIQISVHDYLASVVTVALSLVTNTLETEQQLFRVDARW